MSSWNKIAANLNTLHMQFAYGQSNAVAVSDSSDRSKDKLDQKVKII